MKLAEIFKSHMIFQRDIPIRIFGTGCGIAEVKFINYIKKEKFKDDVWCLQLPEMPAGGPFELKIILDGIEQTLSDIYIGDVWLAGGQSNMELPLKSAQYSEEDLTQDSLIRYYSVKDDNEKNQSWEYCDKDRTLNFSAIGGAFAKYMRRKHNIPIGIISCNKGATCIESWIDKSELLGTPLELPLEKRFLDAKDYPRNNYGELYDLLVSKLIPFGFRGVLWYQGESNRGPYDGKIYSDLLERLVACWRKQFKMPHLPFLIVQLTRYGESDTEQYQWALVRQQQLAACKKIPDVVMITTTDLGQSSEIHPVRKKEIAERLYLAAQYLVFKEKTEYSGPIPESIEIENNNILITFSHSEGMYWRNNNNSIICLDKKGNSISVEAVIKGDKLLLEIPKEINVSEVRGWYCNNARVSLFNSAGLPASPFLFELVE